MGTRIRRVEPSDLQTLTRIYNHYIAETPITFDVEPYTEEKRRPWIEQFAHDGPRQCFVAEIDGTACGWASTGPFRPKAAYDQSVEVSVYLAPEITRRGLGTALYEALFDGLSGAVLHRALAGITLPNPTSVALHARFGFTSVGTFREVGFKFGRYWDVEWFEKAL
jgi:phosphinothricin acetyltransferase